jgi:hypothetical protein
VASATIADAWSALSEWMQCACTICGLPWTTTHTRKLQKGSLYNRLNNMITRQSKIQGRKWCKQTMHALGCMASLVSDS